ncbi:hypothetical protein [Eikenella halliae]|uniref:hypothetical protein n=1 Tax=Eikenella halliae TaxID=1795832 RepID=UPI003607B7D8
MASHPAAYFCLLFDDGIFFMFVWHRMANCAPVAVFFPPALVFYAALRYLDFPFFTQPRISSEGAACRLLPVVAVLRTLNPPGFSQRTTVPG